MSLNGKRIGVMMGGTSAEKDVSLRSGAAVLEALKAGGASAVPLEVVRETEEEIRALVRGHAIDIVFIAMHGGFGEDGRLQAILEKIPVPFTGPKEACSRLAMDKMASRKLFGKAGLRVPRGRCVRKGSNLFFLRFLRYPAVVKPSSQGSSIGVSFVDSRRQLEEALGLAFRFDEVALVEEFIPGREVTVSVLDGEALPIVEIVPKKRFFDFQAKYEKGLTEYVVPAVLDPAVALRCRRDAVTAYHALGCRHLSRVDMILKDDRTPYVLEVNTIPGFTATSLFPKAARAAGIDFPELCVKILKLAEAR